MTRSPLPAVLAAIPAVALSLAACSLGAPPGFSSGDAWSFPLVGPMEDGALLVPVYVNDQGPFLFLIDPDAQVSNIDEALVSQFEMRSGFGPDRLDEGDTRRHVRLADVRSLRLGNLTLSSPDLEVAPVGTFNTDLRQIRGVIGRDIIADSLTFGFDRDRGMAYVTTQKGFTPPTGIKPISYFVLSSRLNESGLPTGRKILDVAISGKSAKLHLDLGSRASQLRQELWGTYGLATVQTKARLVDEVGTPREVTQAGLASNLKVGGLAIPQATMLPYADKRWEQEDIDGTLGLDALRDQVVWVNWDKSELYLAGRSSEDLLSERLARWGSDVFAKCATPGCVAIASDLPATPAAAPAPASDAPAAGAPSTAPIRLAPPRVNYTVTRDPAAAELDLEVLLEAVDPSGARVGWPRYSVNMPKGTASTGFTITPAGQIDPGSVRWVVRDASPFPRACAGAGACAAPLP